MGEWVFRLSRASSKFARTREGYGEGRCSNCIRAIAQSAAFSAALKRPFLVPPAVPRASCPSTGAGVSTMLEKTSLGEFPVYYGGAAKPDRPGVIVLQEWWGVTEEVLSDAEYISRQANYRVLVPDLYKGKIGVDAEEAKHLASELDYGQAVEELKQSADWLRSQGAPKVGVIGFCMGGSLALLAAEYAKVDCAVSFYGVPRSYPSHPEKIKVPVQCHVGTEDKFVPADDVKKFVEEIKAAGGHAELYLYQGEGHAFMNAKPDSLERMQTAGIPEGRDEDRQLAWRRVFEFFKNNLG